MRNQIWTTFFIVLMTITFVWFMLKICHAGIMGFDHAMTPEEHKAGIEQSQRNLDAYMREIIITSRKAYETNHWMTEVAYWKSKDIYFRMIKVTNDYQKKDYVELRKDLFRLKYLLKEYGIDPHYQKFNDFKDAFERNYEAILAQLDELVNVGSSTYAGSVPLPIAP